MPSGELDEIQDRLHYRFRNKRLLTEALTHKSYLNEARRFGEADNERLEFLGDAVLNLVVSAYLVETFPEADEGELSQRSVTQPARKRRLPHSSASIDRGQLFLSSRDSARSARITPPVWHNGQ